MARHVPLRSAVPQRRQRQLPILPRLFEPPRRAHFAAHQRHRRRRRTAHVDRHRGQRTDPVRPRKRQFRFVRRHRERCGHQIAPLRCRPQPVVGRVAFPRRRLHRPAHKYRHPRTAFGLGCRGTVCRTGSQHHANHRRRRTGPVAGHPYRARTARPQTDAAGSRRQRGDIPSQRIANLGHRAKRRDALDDDLVRPDAARRDKRYRAPLLVRRHFGHTSQTTHQPSALRR